MNESPIIEKGRSPFSPGRPVTPDMFVGRGEQIARILRSVGQVRAGKQENLFITGEYGIGKSSLVSYVRSVAEQQYRLAGFHVLLGGVTTLEGLVQRVVSRIVEQAHRSNVLDRLKDLVGKYVESVQLFNVKLNLDALQTDAPDLAQDFLPFLRRLWDRLKGQYAGIAMFWDDLNGIARVPEFAALVKSLVDEIATGGQELPLLLGLSGVPDRRLEMVDNQPSVGRIFDIVEVNPLADEEVQQFFVRAFESVNTPVEADALPTLVRYSGGLPKLMHELGDAVFWADKDDRIDGNDALAGIIQAVVIVGRKYFEPISQALQSSDYHSILRKLGSLKTDLTFHKRDLEKGLNESERRKLNNFLQRMKKLHALLPGETRGEYVFPNRLVSVYLGIASLRKGTP